MARPKNRWSLLSSTGAKTSTGRPRNVISPSYLWDHHPSLAIQRGLSLTSTQCSRDLSTKTAPQHLLHCRYWSAGSRIQETNQDWYNCPSTDCSLHFWRPPLRQVPATLQPEIEEWHMTNLDSMSWPKIYQNGGVKISWSRHSARWCLYIYTIWLCPASFHTTLTVDSSVSLSLGRGC